MITADEDAIRLVPADARKPGTCQDGTAEDDKDVAEITGLLSRAENWPDGLPWIVRRVKPSRRQMRNLTGYEKKTGWRYSVTCTNIPDSGIGGIPGSHHPQFTGVLHRGHACVETGGVRTAKAMGLRNLPSKTWQVNCGQAAAANIAANLAARTRLLGLHDDDDLRNADPGTLRHRIWHLPARLARHARQRTLALSADWPWEAKPASAGHVRTAILIHRERARQRPSNSCYLTAVSRPHGGVVTRVSAGVLCRMRAEAGHNDDGTGQGMFTSSKKHYIRDTVYR